MQLDETGCKTLGPLTTILKSAFIGLCLGVKAQLRMDLRIISPALKGHDGTVDMFLGREIAARVCAWSIFKALRC